MSDDENIDSAPPEDSVPEDAVSEEGHADAVQEGLDEGEDFLEEDWESYDDEAHNDEYDDEDGGGATRAKSSNFNKIVIAVTVIALLGFGGFKMLGTKSEDSGLVPVQKTEEIAQPAPDQKGGFSVDSGVKYGEPVPFEPQESEKEAPSAGILNNPAALAKLNNRDSDLYEDEEPQLVKEAPPMPSPIVQQGLIPMPREMEPKQEIVQKSPSADLPKAQDIVLEKAQDDLEEKLDTILDQLEEIEGRLMQIDKLRRSMTDLESRVLKVEKEPRKIVSKAVAVAPKPVVHTARYSKKNSTKKNPLLVRQWILKSAQPDQAIIAKKDGGDMRRVSVGETVSGLGRVTAIHVQNGQWVVQGTNGKITQ